MPENLPLTFTRTIYDPASKDFVFDSGEKKALPNIKEWIKDHNPYIYWYILRIDNLSDSDISKWAVELYTHQALSITEAYIENIDRLFQPRKSERDAWNEKYSLSITKQSGIPIVGKGLANFRREIINRVPSTPAAEKLMAKYSALDYLGGGGFADVYRATKKDGTVVAIKVPRNLDEKTEDIFFRELNTWERLNHRNIVRFLRPFLTPEPHIEIEYINGNSLYEALKIKSFNTEDACRVAFGIASGLEYAHNRHIIHGDINPRNVLLNSIGEAKITDFGLAKIVTSSSELKGYTLPFAALEMLEERIAHEKSDVYQLGLTFYLMLVGSNPFDAGSRYETEERIKNFTPEPPSKHDSKSGHLDDLIMRCISKNPKERPSPREFRETIYEYLKKNYGVSIHMTEDVERILAVTCRHAMMSAKQEDITECLRALNYAKGKIRDPDIRKDVGNLIEQVEFRAKNEITLEQLLDRMEIFLKRVEWEG